MYLRMYLWMKSCYNVSQINSIQMNHRRASISKESENNYQCKLRQSIGSKVSQVPRKKDLLWNKQNLIQITEPLEPNPPFSSKEFILSKESLGRQSKSAIRQPHCSTALRDNINMLNITNQLSKEFSHDTKEQPPTKNKEIDNAFDRRLSLKCVGNNHPPTHHQISQRLSMAPARRESLGGVTAFSMQSMQYLDERESVGESFTHQVSTDSCKGRHDMKKEAIMTNLMNKLDQEEDIRSIIESKLRVRDRNQSCIAEISEENSRMSSKLKQCQSEIKYFKNIVKEMSSKITMLQEMSSPQPRGSSQSNSTTTARHHHPPTSDYNECPSIENNLVFNTGNSQTGGCGNCGGGMKRNMRRSKECGVQTESSFNQRQQYKSFEKEQSGDFMQNLDRTLKLLELKTNR